MRTSCRLGAGPTRSAAWGAGAAAVAHLFALATAVATAVGAAAAPAAAQQRAAPPPADSARRDSLARADSLARVVASADSAQRACRGGVVTAVQVRREAPRIITNGPAWSRAILSAVLQYRTTEPSVVTDFLRLREGSICDEVARTESERILRAQRFIADARIAAVPDSAGSGTRLVVETVDEVPLILNVSTGGGGLSSLQYGNGNVMGRGQLASVRWWQGKAFRDGIGARYEHYHLLGGPNTLSVQADRAPLGSDALLSLGHPFLTPLQRLAWIASYRNDRGYRDFVRRDEETVSMETNRSQYAAGGVYRVADIGRGALSGVFVGALATHERVEPGDATVRITDDGLVADTATLLARRYDPFSRNHWSGVLGLSLVRFLAVRGFDALEGVQDVGRGAQLALSADPGWFSDRGRFLSGDFYGGAGSDRSFVGMRARAEGENAAGDWRDVVAAGRVAWYLHPSTRRTFILSGEYTGGWHTRIPYQLRLEERRGGLIGYRGSDIAGARRIVGRAEQRWVLQSHTSFLGLGAALFGQVGKTWAGDVPYAVTSGPRTSVGVGVLGAVPRESRRLLRVDVAYPLPRDPGTGLEVRVGTSAPLRGFWREPSDIARARAASGGADIFTWP